VEPGADPSLPSGADPGAPSRQTTSGPAPHPRLTWQGQTFVLSGGADVTREVRIELATGSVAVLRETLVLGRTGEPGGRLLQTSRATLDGHPLLAEDLDLAPSQLRPGALGPWRVVDTLSILGRRAPGIPPPAAGSHRLDLDARAEPRHRSPCRITRAGVGGDDL